MIHITECPRDAMQGIHDFIPTDRKIEYLNALLKVGFPVLDAGSFVSPAAIPQMADTTDVFNALMHEPTTSKILAIIANLRGAEAAINHPWVSILGYPFSVSETFQQRNTKSSISESYKRVEEMVKISQQANKQLNVYLSMAFGNPYGDEWSPAIVRNHARKLADLGVTSLSLADTTGISTPQSVKELFETIAPEFPEVNFSLHLHALPEDVAIKTEAAVNAGCRALDTALKGYGGCPMATDTLTGNMATETVVLWCNANNIEHQLNLDALKNAEQLANRLFADYH